MPTSWNRVFVESSTAKRPDRIRLLLDQGFPKPPGFDPSSVDHNLEWVHLWDWKRELSEVSTPDWVLYCEAASNGFTAMVTRDFSQADQAEEMLALSRLRDFHIITWRSGIDDPISEWGQLLAYLPKLRRHFAEQDAQVIRLPAPNLSAKNVERPKAYLAAIATSRGQSTQQVRREAEQSMKDWEGMRHGTAGRYTDQLFPAR